MSDDEHFENEEAHKKKNLASSLWGDDSAEDDEDEEDYTRPTGGSQRQAEADVSTQDRNTGRSASSSAGVDQSRAARREDQEEAQRQRMIQERRERTRIREAVESGDSAYGRDIHIELNEGPRVRKDSNIYLSKLSAGLGVNSKPFDASDFHWNQDKQPHLGESLDEDNERPRTENMIRWQWTRDRYGEPMMQSNTQLVKWNDGSFTLFVGKTAIPVTVDDLKQPHQIFSRQSGTVLRSEAPLKQRMMFHPPTSARRRMRANARVAKSDKNMTRIVADDIDPQLARKQAEQIEAAQSRIEMRLKHSQLKTRRAAPDALNKDWLEAGDSDNEDDDAGLQEELEADSRLNAAKQGLSSRPAKRRKTRDFDDEDDDDDDVDV